MNKETVQEIQKALQPLADKLGEGAKFVYETYVRQQYIYGVASLIVIALILVVAAVASKYWWEYCQTVITESQAGYLAAKENDRQYVSRMDFPDIGMWKAGQILPVIAVQVTVWIITFTWGYDALLHLLNPHYYAIQSLLTSIRGGNGQ